MNSVPVLDPKRRKKLGENSVAAPRRDEHGRLRGGNPGNRGGRRGRSGRPRSEFVSWVFAMRDTLARDAFEQVLRSRRNPGLRLRKGGMIEGVIEAPEAIIGGEVRGAVRATHRVAVQASAALHGTITTPRLAVEEGATLDVELCMREPAAPLDPSDRHSDIRKLSPDPAITHEDKNVVGLGLAR